MNIVKHLRSNPSRAIGMALVLGAGSLLTARALRQRRRISFDGKSVLIFGGSRGLGLVLARLLGGEGARLVLAARDADELTRARDDLRLRGIQAMTISCDVTNRAQVEATVRQAATAHGLIDVLVNNAGIIQVGPLAHMTVADFEQAMATHFWGPLYATLAALPHMRTGARRIVNISSIAGKVAVPHLLPYCASKFALTGLSEGLRSELAQDGIAVTTVCPGLMRTGSTYNAQFKGQHALEFAWFHMSDALPGLSVAAERAARQIVDACRYGDPELIITPAARAAVVLNAVSPGTMGRAMTLANAVLPGPGAADGQSKSGWQSTSRFAPSPLTLLADRATAMNNEVPGNGRPADPEPAT
jgi:NAD(P)-dependent dehydrogenase (short-subunit alcohol dehydrogenase family)